MKEFSLHASSIYNIDFVAIPFAIDHFGGISLSVFLNSKVSIASNKEHRQFESRLAIPSLKWKMDNNNDWRLIHYPIESLNNNFQIKFEEIKNSYLKVFPKNEKQIISFFKEITLLYNGAESPIAFYKKLIDYSISSSFDGVELSTLFLESAYNLKNENVAIKTIKTLKSIFSVNGRYKLNCGGRVEFLGEYSVQIKEFRISERTLVVGSTGNQFTIKLNKLFESIKSNKTKVRFYGMIELLYINQYGNSLHLPSYCKISKTETANSLNSYYEFISPMSNNDLERSLEKSLDPLGYSLMDFDYDTFKIGLELLLDEKLPNQKSLNDWLLLYKDYPRSNEKASADQNPSMKHFENKIKTLKKQLHNANYESLTYLESDSFSFYSAGEMFAQNFALYRNIIEAIHVPDKFKKNLNTFLKTKESDFIESQIESTTSNLLFLSKKLEYLGLNSSLVLELNKDIENLSKSVFSKSISKLNYIEYEDIFLKAMSLIRKVILQYYKFVAFLISTVFKSNLFLLSLIYSREEIKKNTKEVKQKREHYFLTHYPNFITKIEDFGT